LQQFIDFKVGGGGDFGNWFHPSNLASFGLSNFSLVCVQTFMEIGRQIAECQNLNDFQDGGGGHLGKRRHTSAFVIVVLGIF
jgi:hypothetical protein